MGRKHEVAAGFAALTLFDIAAATAAPPVAYNWTGFYVGGHFGVRWSNSSSSSSPYSFDLGPTLDFPGTSANYSSSSPLVGVHFGYNRLLTGSWLVGIEGDFSYASNRSNYFSSGTDSVSGDGFAFRGISTLLLTWQATLRGRLGYVTGPWLFYGTGGVAFIHAKWTDTSSVESLGGFPLPVDPTIASWSTSKVLTGGVVGVGVEYMLSSTLIARAEYLYESFGSFDVPVGFGPQTGSVNVGDVHKLRFGVSVKVGP